MLTRLGLFSVFLFPGLCWAQLKVVTSTPDLAALVAEISNQKLEVTSIGKGTQDPHQIEAKPSFLVKLRTADLVVLQGLELESAWMDSLLLSSRNPKIAKGTPGYLELAPHLDPLEIKHGPVSRAEGDIHPGGNPHFQLDPIRMGKAAVLIAQRLSELDSSQKENFLKRAQAIEDRLKSKTPQWKARIDKCKLKSFVTYHKTFVYFAHRFGIENDLFIEPKPGIPPTTKHLEFLIQEMKKKEIQLVLIENYFSDQALDKIKSLLPRARGGKVAVSVGGAPGINTTDELIDQIVKTIEASCL